jgi:hypothetical protein
LIQNYHLSPPMKRSQFEQICAPADLKSDFYMQLVDQRDQKLSLEFVYDSEDAQPDFERKWCCAPVGLAGVRLQARIRGSLSDRRRGEVLAGALDEKIVTALAQACLPMLIIPPADVGAMIAHLRGTNLWARGLTVRFPDATIDEGYRAFLGTAAFHAHAELQGHFLMRDRLKPDAIII